MSTLHSPQNSSKHESKNNSISNFKSTIMSKTTLPVSQSNTIKDHISISTRSNQIYDNSLSSPLHKIKNSRKIESPFNFDHKFTLNKQKVVSNIREKFLLAQKKASFTKNSQFTNNNSKIEERIGEENRVNTEDTKNNNSPPNVERNNKRDHSLEKIQNIKQIGPHTKKLKVPDGYYYNNITNRITKNENLNNKNNKTYNHKNSVSPLTSRDPFSTLFSIKSNENSVISKKKTMKSFKDATTGNLEINDDFQKMIKEKLSYKKKLKGKLLQTISKSIVLDTDTYEHYIQEKNYLSSNLNIEHLMNYRKEKNIGIMTQKSPDVLQPKSSAYTSRYEDCFVTPDELIDKNFEKKDILTIKSDPAFFKLNRSPYKDISVLKNTTLLEQLTEEEKQKIKMLKKNQKKQNKLKMNKYNMISNLEHNMGNKTERLNSEKIDNNEKLCLTDRSSKVKELSKFKFNSNQLESKTKHKIQNFDEKSKNKIQSYGFTHLRGFQFGEIPEIKVIDLRKKEQDDKIVLQNYNNKMKIYSERRRILSQQNKDKIQNNKEHSAEMKKIYQLNKEKELESMFITSRYVEKIKDIYRGKESK